MTYNLDWLLNRIIDEPRVKYLSFWGHRPQKDGSVGQGCLSQWWLAPFLIDSIIYNSAEHYMMAEKARLFSDDDALGKILVCQTPAEAKKLGRTVRDFAPLIWNSVSFEVVVRGNFHKFSQNETLKSFLLGTGDRVLVEASPVDAIWGIGLAKDDPDAENPAKWPGRNLLGFALMEVRDQLR
jgi:ribA/ribD-fused uncharacterized protein